MKKILRFLRKIFGVHSPRQPHKEYIERDTTCDKCKYLNECITEGIVCSCTTIVDTREHYICGPASNCKAVDELMKYWEKEI